jgi:hypothetical protein
VRVYPWRPALCCNALRPSLPLPRPRCPDATSLNPPTRSTVQVVTARTNVDALLKRQVTMYKEHRDRVTGVVTPAKWEMQGSHGIACHLIPDGC